MASDMTTPTREAQMALADEFAQAFSDRFDSVIHGDGSVPTSEAARAALASAIAEALSDAHAQGLTSGAQIAMEERAEAVRDAALGAAIQNAARDMPEAFGLYVCVERGAGWVELYDDRYERVALPEDDERDLGREVLSAIDAARSAAQKTAGV